MKVTPKILTGWVYAKQFLNTVYDWEYGADVWPQRLGLEDIAALQASSKDCPVIEAWTTCLFKASEAGEIITHTDQWFSASLEPIWRRKVERQARLVIPPCQIEQQRDVVEFFRSADRIKRTTASARDFAAYLKKIGETPSEYIAAWLDTFGIDTIEPKKDIERKKNHEEKPWLLPRPDDPEPEQHWYTPARYFARELVKKDSTLLQKKSLLAEKVVKSLSEVDIFKRGGKKPFDPATVLKAFANISLG